MTHRKGARFSLQDNVVESIEAIKPAPADDDTKNHEPHIGFTDANEKKHHKSYKRANTYVGVMNKYLLQFPRVAKAYYTIENATLLIDNKKLKRSRATQAERMRRKYHVISIPNILKHLGFTIEFSAQELEKMFNHDLSKNVDTITFQRILIGVAACFFESERRFALTDQEKENSNTEIEYDSQGNPKVSDIIPPSPVPQPSPLMSPEDFKDNANASSPFPLISANQQKPSKNSMVNKIMQNAKNKNESSSRQSLSGQGRYTRLKAGFKVVSSMFATIDTRHSGTIEKDEFEAAFCDVCKDPLIVKARMSEMDYNSDYKISLNEFVFGIASWIGFNEYMDADEDDADLDAYVSDEDNDDTAENENK